MGPIIDITPLFPYRILMHIAEVFAYYNIAHSITKDKYHPAITIAAIFAAKELWAALLFNTHIEITGYIFFGITLFIILRLLTKGRTSEMVVSVIFGILSKIVSAIAMSIILEIFYSRNHLALMETLGKNEVFLYIFLCQCIFTVAISYFL